MPGNPHPIDVAIVDNVAVDKSDVRAYEKNQNRVRVADANEIRNTDFSGQVAGVSILGAFFDLDSTDMTSPDDGSNVIIDATGNRFKIVNTDMLSEIAYVIWGGGASLSTGDWGWLPIPFNCTITSAMLLSDVVGNAVIDIWKSTYAGFPPSSSGSICAAALPTLSAAVKSLDVTLTGWSKSLIKNDILNYRLISVAGPQRLMLNLGVLKAITMP